MSDAQKPGPLPGDKRRPLGVYAVGSEPDPRFSMANERTALAWVRTSLALVAAGVGLTTLAHLADLHHALHLVASMLCLAGGWMAVSAVLGWRRREVALRLGAQLPAPVALPWLAGAIVVGGIVIAGVAIVSQLGLW